MAIVVVVVVILKSGVRAISFRDISFVFLYSVVIEVMNV